MSRIDGSTILTRSGRYVDPLNLQPEDVLVDDVAWALSHQCRYSGHCAAFYSVAEHSVRVLRWLRDEGFGRDVQAWGLLHDATEAYLVDLPRPLKQHPTFGAVYREAEGRALAAVAEAFGLAPVVPPAVREADLALLATERRDLMPPGGEWAILNGVAPSAEPIVPWSPARARDTFLGEYRLLNCRREPGGGVSASVSRCRSASGPMVAEAEPSRQEPSHEPVTSEIRALASTGAAKGRKPARRSLLPGRALGKVAVHFGFGERKYEAHNWRAGYPWSWSLDALGRHYDAYVDGDTIDPESGSSHMAAVAFHALALLTFEDEHPELDDRWRP